VGKDRYELHLLVTTVKCLLLQSWSTLSLSKVAAASHHIVLKRFASAAGVAIIAETLLGLMNGQLIKESEAERQPFSVTQTFALIPLASTSTVLRPIDSLPEAVLVDVTAELPSSVTFGFQLPGDDVVLLSVHVQPQTYDSSAVMLILHRNFMTWPCADKLIQYEPSHLSAALLYRARLAVPWVCLLNVLVQSHRDFNTPVTKILATSAPASVALYLMGI
jgi:hypothetical protein